MASQAFTIYSHYNPEDRELLEFETGQISIEDIGIAKDDAEAAEKALWQAEASQIYRRPTIPPPQFIRATMPYDDWTSQDRPPAESSISPSTDISDWYRSLRRNNDSNNVPVKPSSSTSYNTSSSLVTERKTKNNWFIMNALHSEDAPSASSPRPAPTLADILEREPPSKNNEDKFTPPVWLAIGPSNKGFSMLQQRGWNEGEPLGADVIRQPIHSTLLPHNVKGKRKATVSEGPVKAEIVEFNLDEDVKELRRVEVVDLTMSSESESESDGDKIDDSFDNILNSTSSSVNSVPHRQRDSDGRRALLTPIPTILKSDRLGIGLKAQTVGPYRKSKKRVTHNAAALAAHLRSVESVQIRQKVFGRGQKGFERQRKKESDGRRSLLAYLNE